MSTSRDTIHADRPINPGNLTARELQIMSLIACGYTNQEIADVLYLSINSVKTYIRSAYRRLEITRRTQAVIWGIQHGLADVGAGEATG